MLLSFANGRWRAVGLGVDLEHTDLRSLESLIEARLADSGAAWVAVRFDVSSLPDWMRQHQSHYFNYRLRLAPPRDRSSRPWPNASA
jgi:hypothetical protein